MDFFRAKIVGANIGRSTYDDKTVFTVSKLNLGVLLLFDLVYSTWFKRDANQIARNFADIELVGLRLKEGQRVHPREDRQQTVTSPKFKMGTKPIHRYWFCSHCARFSSSILLLWRAERNVWRKLNSPFLIDSYIPSYFFHPSLVSFPPFATTTQEFALQTASQTVVNPDSSKCSRVSLLPSPIFSILALSLPPCADDIPPSRSSTGGRRLVESNRPSYRPCFVRASRPFDPQFLLGRDKKG